MSGIKRLCVTNQCLRPSLLRQHSGAVLEGAGSGEGLGPREERRALPQAHAHLEREALCFQARWVASGSLSPPGLGADKRKWCLLVFGGQECGTRSWKGAALPAPSDGPCMSAHWLPWRECPCPDVPLLGTRHSWIQTHPTELVLTSSSAKTLFPSGKGHTQGLGALGSHTILEGHSPSCKVAFPGELSVYSRSSPFWKGREGEAFGARCAGRR